MKRKLLMSVACVVVAACAATVLPSLSAAQQTCSETELALVRDLQQYYLACVQQYGSNGFMDFMACSQVNGGSLSGAVSPSCLMALKHRITPIKIMPLMETTP